MWQRSMPPMYATSLPLADLGGSQCLDEAAHLRVIDRVDPRSIRS